MSPIRSDQSGRPGRSGINDNAPRRLAEGVFRRLSVSLCQALRRASISAAVGIEAAAPRRVTEMPAVAEP